MIKIKKITALEILDSRGNPTVEASIFLDDGTVGTAAAPSGASTGSFEAVELRDKEKRYGGLGVLSACENINGVIQKNLTGLKVTSQRRIDKILNDLDGTEDKSRLGANAILAVSLACARAASISQKIPLFQYIAKTYKFKKSRKMPVAFFNIINGGKHSDSGLSIQEFQIIPYGFRRISDQVRCASEVYHKLKELLLNAGLSAGVGDEGGFAPNLESQTEAFDYLVRATEEAGYELNKEVSLGIDAAASNFFNQEQNCYTLKPENTSLEGERLISLYQEWKLKHSISSIEDGLEENDWEGWKKMNRRLSENEKDLVIGDDLLTTNVKRLEKAVSFEACNAAIVKPNQIGTLTETIDFIKKAKENKIKCVISHRSGETCDDFIADLAVACGAEFVKFGAPCRGERVAKYNRLMEIEMIKS